MTTEHLIGIGDDRPRETQATHCAQGQIYLRASAAELYPRSAIDAAIAAECERCAAIALRWGETHADGETVNARNAASKIARGIRQDGYNAAAHAAAYPGF